MGSPNSSNVPLVYRQSKRVRRKRVPLVRLGLLTLLLAIALRQGQLWIMQPQAILVLGGSPEREQFAASFAQRHPQLPIWISSGSNQEYSQWVFTEAGIEGDRLHLDYRASDTVTNFTTLVDEFKDQDISNLYLITSDFHMRRARVIGTIVLGSRGIDFKPVQVPSSLETESWGKVTRDAVRSVLWVATGHTGARLGRHFE
ncbi:MAG: YdcF family protein [Kaiparowitsia implicata GSE-PSE-MK54-09C]|jgi:uncharacterized SAM-binding protein YcdF (DUF218 family)|nr:YdcF family protein [Kaiparowitsia implicata GSE-PSE-MK54-09C]